MNRVLVTYSESDNRGNMYINSVMSTGYFGDTWQAHLREVLTAGVMPQPRNNLQVNYGNEVDELMDSLPETWKEAEKHLVGKQVAICFYDVELGKCIV